MNRLYLLTAAALALVVGMFVVLYGYADKHVAARTMERTELYFGAVAPDQWDAFLAEEVTPRFPDGLTWFDVQGQWRGPSGQPEKLPSRLLIVLHADNAHNDQALDEIGQLFKQRFGLAVLRASVTVKASDPDWSEQRVKDNPQLSAAH